MAAKGGFPGAALVSAARSTTGAPVLTAHPAMTTAAIAHARPVLREGRIISVLKQH